MRTVIYNARAVLPGRIMEGARIEVDGGRIASLSAGRKRPSRGKGCLALNARGNFASPGFIDTHIHGLPREIFEHEARFGTTAVLPTVSCTSREGLRSFVDAVEDFVSEDPRGRNVVGLRLEGPFINPAKAGAQDARFIRSPGIRILRDVLSLSKGLLRIMTIAPEMRGALPLIRELKRRRILASIGHSNATYREARQGIRAGISHATHTFNAMRPFEGREPGAVGAVLESDDVWAEVVLDLAHVHEATFRLLLKTKGVDHVILVTDSLTCVRPSQRPPKVSRTNGAYRFPDGRIAGSCVTMNRAVANAVLAGGLSVAEAVRLATVNAARALGIEKKKGTLGTGMDADIILFDERFNVTLTMIGGRIVHSVRERTG